jgi:hypothetical protein
MKEYWLTSGLLDRKRRLILTPDFVEFENRDLNGSEFTRLDKSDIVDFRHSVEAIVWYKFVVGRHFSFNIKDRANRELRFSFDSYFGFRKESARHYASIVGDIWEYYQTDILNTYLKRYYEQEELKLCGIGISLMGIELVDRNAFLVWDQVRIKKYYQYFAIYDKNMPESHARISYNQYGARTLSAMLRTILRHLE